MKLKNITIEPRVLLAEVFGTFTLALVAVTIGNPIILGFVLIVLVLALFSISGAHLNPAVTFGLWAVKKVETLMVPFYWAAQVLGGLLALWVMQIFRGESFGLSLGSFGSFDGRLVGIEVIGMAVFAFAIAAAVHRGLADSAKAVAIGFGLLTGLTIGSGLLGQALQELKPSENGQPARITKVDGPVLNPAIALAATEKKDQTGLFEEGTQKETGRAPSRLSWETLVGALAGGAIGMNLYFLIAGVNPFEKKQSVAAKVKKVVKKVKK